MDEGHAVTAEPLENEPFPTEETGTQSFVEGDADVGAQGGAQECVLLTKNLLADLGHVQTHDSSRVGGSEGDVLLATTVIREVRDEEGLARERTLTGVQELADDGLVGLRSVAHPGFEVDAIFHVVHGSGLGDHGFAGIELDLHQLHVVAPNRVVQFMTFHAHHP